MGLAVSYVATCMYHHYAQLGTRYLQVFKYVASVTSLVPHKTSISRISNKLLKKLTTLHHQKILSLLGVNVNFQNNRLIFKIKRKKVLKV